MKLLKLSLTLILCVGIVFISIPNVHADETSELLLKLLVKKGIVTQKEADELRAEVKGIEGKKEIVTAERKPEDFRVYWKEGLNFDTDDKKFKLKIGGRIYADSGWIQRDGDIKGVAGESNTDAEFRAARLGASGTIYDDFLYKIEMDFVGGDADFKDVYLGMTHIPYLGTLKVGHFKEPFSLEELTSSRFITFMERALPNALAPGRNLGIAVNSSAFDERVTWAAGIFRDADDFGTVTANDYDATARITGLPWYKDKDKLLHLGAAYSFRQSDVTLQYRQRPENHMETYYVNTGVMNIDFNNLFGYEAALLYGPFSLQGEYIHSIVNQMDGASNSYFQGMYGQASYFLTGEHRNYKKSSGAFDRVKPKKNFSLKDKTFGAWELAGRYSYLDLSEDRISGRIMQDASVGINWYLNPNMRIMGNFIHSHVNDYGDADMFLTRFQVDF